MREMFAPGFPRPARGGACRAFTQGVVVVVIAIFIVIDIVSVIVIVIVIAILIVIVIVIAIILIVIFIVIVVAAVVVSGWGAGNRAMAFNLYRCLSPTRKLCRNWGPFSRSMVVGDVVKVERSAARVM